MNKKQSVPDCCQTSKKSGVKEGIIYGLLPHAGCIAFIAASVFGATALTQLFRPIMLSSMFLPTMIMLSLVFATISAVLYLRKHNQLSLDGAKSRWKYLTTMYGITLGVNLLFFMVIFPAFATATINSQITTDNTLTINVAIPCSGHASLITGELAKLGITQVQYTAPGTFKMDLGSATKEQVLALDVFKDYPATVVNKVTENAVLTAPESTVSKAVSSTATSAKSSCGCGH